MMTLTKWWNSNLMNRSLKDHRVHIMLIFLQKFIEQQSHGLVRFVRNTKPRIYNNPVQTQITSSEVWTKHVASLQRNAFHILKTCEGNSLVTDGFPWIGPTMQRFDGLLRLLSTKGWTRYGVLGETWVVSVVYENRIPINREDSKA